MKDKPDNIREERTNVQFSCPVAIRDEMKRIAEEEDRNLGMQIVKCLRDWLSAEAKADV